MRAIPDAFNFMEQEATQLLPALGAFGAAFVDVLPPVLDVGGAILSVALPAMTALLTILSGAAPVATAFGDGLAFVGGVLGAILGPLSPLLSGVGELVATFAVAASVVPVLSSVGGTLASVLSVGLVPALQLLGKAMWASLGPFGIAIGAIATIISVMGWWDDTIRLAQKSFNALVSLVAGNAGIIAKAVGGAVNFVIGAIKGLIKQVNRLPMVNIKTGLEKVDTGKLEDQIAGTEDMKVATDGKLGGGGSSGTSGDGPGSSPDPVPGSSPSTSGGDTTNIYEGDTKVQVDARGSEASKGEIKSYVEEALQEDKKRSRKRGSSIS